MTPTLIAALGSALAVVISSIFAGLLQLQHNRAYHGDDGQAAAAPPPPATPPAGSQR